MISCIILNKETSIKKSWHFSETALYSVMDNTAIGGCCLRKTPVIEEDVFIKHPIELQAYGTRQQ